MSKLRASSLCAALAALAVGALAEAQHVGGGGHAGGGGGLGGGAHQHIDARFSHNQYYFDRGYTVRQAPRGGYSFAHGPDGGRYWYHGGNWYRWRGGGWVVWGAPLGLYVPFLPPYFTTVWWYGVPYYYANDTYYIWDDGRQQYQVVEPPAGIDPNGSTRPPPSDQLFVYPKNGQSAEQQSKDQFECHQWAVGQTGFDPTASGGAVPADQAVAKRNDYFRAQVSCLEGRGYSVK